MDVKYTGQHPALARNPMNPIGGMMGRGPFHESLNGRIGGTGLHPNTTHNIPNAIHPIGDMPGNGPIKRNSPDPPKESEKRKRKFYTSETKLMYMKEAEKDGLNAVTRKYNLPNTNMKTWMRMYKEKGEEAFNNPGESHVKSEREEGKGSKADVIRKQANSPEGNKSSIGRRERIGPPVESVQEKLSEPRLRYQIIKHMFKSTTENISEKVGVPGKTLEDWKSEYVGNRVKYGGMMGKPEGRESALREAMLIGEEAVCLKYGITTLMLKQWRGAIEITPYNPPLTSPPSYDQSHPYPNTPGYINSDYILNNNPYQGEGDIANNLLSNITALPNLNINKLNKLCTRSSMLTLSPPQVENLKVLARLVNFIIQIYEQHIGQDSLLQPAQGGYRQGNTGYAEEEAIQSHTQNIPNGNHNSAC